MAEELCSTDNLTSLLSPILHDLLLLCSFLFHHPVTLAYVFLLSPYLLNLFLFLYPLLFSTSLLFLAILTVSPDFYDPPSTSDELPGSVCRAVFNILPVELVPDDAKESLAEQICSMVLVIGDNVNEMVLNEVHFLYDSGNQPKQLVSASQNCIFSEDVKSKEDRGENLSENSGENLNLCSESRPVKEESITKTILPCRKERSRRPSEILRRDGSARKEKEWKRTLACKLFEERMTYKLFEDRKAVVEGAEEMDLLWEAYEVDAHKAEKQRRKQKHEKKAKNEDNDYDDEYMSGRPCCLKALRFSAGKMNLGLGRPSLLNISIALKGMTLFHSAGRRSRRE